VDHGDGTEGGLGQAPILVRDGKFDSGTVVPRFEREAAQMPPTCATSILAKMRAHLIALYRQKMGRKRVRRERWQQRRPGSRLSKELTPPPR